jgi:hypothetical protein
VVTSVLVPAERLERWVAGFGERHPGVRATVWAGRVLLSAPGGSTAELFAPFPPLTALAVPPVAKQPQPGPIDHPHPELAGPPPGQAAVDPPLHPLGEADPVQAATALVANAFSVPVLRALMIRRGGYACAVLTDDRVTTSKVGSRYVQGRTAAGGWSQQRFARRREGQANALVDAATEVAVRILLPVSVQDGLITGGDRPLIDQVLADPRLRSLSRLCRGPHLEIGDPKIDLVTDLPTLGRAIRITLDQRL